MYDAFVTQEPNRQADGMVHFTVEFRDSTGVLPVVPQKSFTATFTEEWFKRWCKKQVEILNTPQETTAIVAGKVDLTGVTEPVVDAETTTYQRNVQLIARLNWIRDNFDPSVVTHKKYTDCVTALTKAEYLKKHLDVIPAR